MLTVSRSPLAHTHLTINPAETKHPSSNSPPHNSLPHTLYALHLSSFQPRSIRRMTSEATRLGGFIPYRSAILTRNSMPPQPAEGYLPATRLSSALGVRRGADGGSVPSAPFPCLPSPPIGSYLWSFVYARSRGPR